MYSRNSKPTIRKNAKKGDWVIGTGATGNVGNGKLIYCMKVTETPLSFHEYDKDKRFQKKKPKTHSDLRYERGDNIYFIDKWGEWSQRLSMHCRGDMKKDLGGKRVLVSKHFWYFGRNALNVPKRFQELVFIGRNYKSKFPQSLVHQFIEWLDKNHAKGIQGDPCQYWYDPLKKNLKQKAMSCK